MRAFHRFGFAGVWPPVGGFAFGEEAEESRLSRRLPSPTSLMDGDSLGVFGGSDGGDGGAEGGVRGDGGAGAGERVASQSPASASLACASVGGEAGGEGAGEGLRRALLRGEPESGIWLGLGLG